MNKSLQYKIMKAAGALIKFERMRKNISINKIASDLNVNPSTIVSIEDCKHQASFMNIIMIVDYLQIDLQAFIVLIKKADA